MGCDIHPYIEYRLPSWNDDQWSSLARRASPGRDYSMFAIMADVRSYGENKEGDLFFTPRGMPKDGGYAANNDNRLFISEDDPEGEGNVSPSQAEHWIKNDPSLQCEDPRWVYHPDWHSHSHLTAGEFDKVIEEYVKRFDHQPGIGWKVLHSSLKTLVDNGYMARLVFWFDN